jgi:acyl-CoA hydrolase
MEVGVKVIAENYTKDKNLHANSAYLTFVGVDENGKPVKTFDIIPTTDEEKRRFEEALKRRQNRLSARKAPD